MFPPAGAVEVLHANDPAISSRIKGGSDRYILDVSAGQFYCPRQNAEVDVIVERRFGRKDDFPNAAPVLLVGKGELDDYPEPAYECLVHILAQVRSQNGNAFVFFH